MPTGFTSKMYEGKPETFEEFVLHCARGTGAFIMQRDNDPNEPPKMRQAEPYYAISLGKAKNDLHLWEYMDADDKYSLWGDYKVQTEDDIKRRKQQNTLRLSMYEHRLREVEAWNAPEMLQSLKNFMIDQIKSSIDFDIHEYPQKIMEFDDWEANEDERRRRSVEYSQESYDEEIERVKRQNEYTALLYSSLGMEYVK